MRFASSFALCLLVSTAIVFAQDDKPREDQLPADAVLRLGSTKLRHAANVQAVSFSPDSKSVASADSEYAVRIWDVASGSLVREIPGKTGSIVRFSPKGDILAAGGYYMQQITLFDAKYGERLRIVPQNGRSFMFSDDGRQLVAVGKDAIVRLWNVADGSLAQKFKGHSGGLFAAAISHDGKTVASGGGGDGTAPDKNEVRLWNAETGDQIAQFEENLMGDARRLKGWIYDLDFSPDDKTLAVATPYSVRVWNIAQKKELQLFEKGSYAVRFAPDENRLLVAGSFQVYDALAGRAVVNLDGKLWDEQTRCLDYSPDGALVATGDEQGRVRLWDARNGEEIVRSSGHRLAVTGVAFSPDGTSVASLCRGDGTIKVWGLAKGTQIRSIDVEWKGSEVYWSREGSELFFPSYGRDVVTWTYDGTLHFHELASREHRRVSLGSTDKSSSSGRSIVGGTLSEDGTRCAVVAYGGSRPTVRCYELDGVKFLDELNPFNKSGGGSDDWVSCLALSKDGKTLAMGVRTRDKAGDTIQLWDVDAGERLRSFRVDENAPGKLVFSPDGTMLAVAPTGYTPAQIWRVSDGKELHRLNEKDKNRSWYDWSPIAFAPDGKSVAVATQAKEIVIWELATGQAAKTFTGHTGIIRSLAFSPAGERLASGSADATVILWNVSGRKIAERELDEKQLEYLWKDLASANSRVADAAMKALSECPRSTLAHFRIKLHGAADPDPVKLPELIATLETGDAKEKEIALSFLRSYGDKASAEIFQALKKSSPEVRGELEGLLAEIDASPIPPAQLQRSRGIIVLERIGDDDAQSQLKALIAAAPKSITAAEAQAALERLKGRRNPPKTNVAPEE